MLWYEGYPEQPGPESIGLATSSDGVTFTKDADPVIPAGACGTAPDAAVFQPNVLVTDAGYVMLFGASRKRAARRRSSPRRALMGARGPAQAMARLPASNSSADPPMSTRSRRSTATGSPPRCSRSCRGDHTELWLGEIVPG